MGTDQMEKLKNILSKLKTANDPKGQNKKLEPKTSYKPPILKPAPISQRTDASSQPSIRQTPMPVPTKLDIGDEPYEFESKSEQTETPKTTITTPPKSEMKDKMREAIKRVD